MTARLKPMPFPKPVLINGTTEVVPLSKPILINGTIEVVPFPKSIPEHRT